MKIITQSLFRCVFMALLVLCYKEQLPGEIQKVTVSWTPGLCQTSCVPLLTARLSKILGVETVTVQQFSGVAVLTWKKRVRFNYESINSAMRMVGLSAWTIRVRAHGKLQQDPNHDYLVSLGDGTVFELVNPVIPSLTAQTIQYNLQGRKLTPEMQRKLSDGVKGGKTVIIEGAIFMPWRHYVPVELIIDQLIFVDGNKKE